MSDNERRSYRKVYKRLWADPEFIAMTDSERNMALYVLTGPQTNRIGLFKLSIPLAAEDLKRPLNTVRRVFANVVKAFRWEYDATTRVLWIPSWWKYNPPPKQSSNIKGYLSDLSDLPKTALLAKFRGNLIDIPRTLHEHFHERGPITAADTAPSTEARSAASSEVSTAPSTVLATQTQTHLQTHLQTETPAADASPPQRPMAPIHTSHRRHVVCGRVCLHESQFDEFVRRRNGAREAVRTWAASVVDDWTQGAHAAEEPGDSFDFWRARYAETWPTSAAAVGVIGAVKSARSLVPATPFRESCVHIPPCSSAGECLQRRIAERQTQEAIG